MMYCRATPLTLAPNTWTLSVISSGLARTVGCDGTMFIFAMVGGSLATLGLGLFTLAPFPFGWPGLLTTPALPGDIGTGAGGIFRVAKTSIGKGAMKSSSFVNNRCR